ncbi:MAG: M28 family peptidase [Planctomycetaceae bacterium]|nr:M28 family peptidase [Planctomycetaceae bacterium]
MHAIFEILKIARCLPRFEIVMFQLFVVGFVFEVGYQTSIAQDESSLDQQSEQSESDLPLSKRWEDYLLSPITDGDRKWALDAMTEAERIELTEVLKKTEFQLDPIAAQVYIKRICEMGPRISGSESMAVQQAALIRHFGELGYSVARQSFDVPHPETRVNTTLTNLIVQLHPERKLRILICCHYDTRPFADRDPVNPKSLLPGANDGASGVAFLMMLAPHLKELGPRLGIDLVFFDAEELIYVRERDKLFLGSTHFAEQYVRSPPDHRYRAGVLVDMIADRTLELYHEKNSLKYAGPLTKQIWLKAQKLGIKDFVPKPKHEVRDDHLPLNEIAKIPTTDLIDFDYPSMTAKESYWHTAKDTVDKCSPLSMAKVGVVLVEWAKDYVK